MSLPNYFCWTRYGPEAGETFEAILERKERERLGNGGVFLWGVGNSIGPSIPILLRKTSTPSVVFSPIRSTPRPRDVTPTEVVSWVRGETHLGAGYTVPDASVVTSTRSIRAVHYALVCYSQSKLELEREPPELCFSALRNLTSGRPLGSSQVTAVVERLAESRRDLVYPATFVAQLHPPYFVKLTVWKDVGVGAGDQRSLFD